MQTPPTPADEDDRLHALRELLILDTPPEERFDRIVAFAAQEFDMPMAFVTLVDAERQWFKARVGSDTVETARDVSFCAHAILQDEPLVIENALQDDRFHDNPLVTGDPHIRFYAGAPLALPGGQSVGTLCIIDRQPRALDRVELAILKSLRDLAVEELVRQDKAAR
ncbi:MAG: GAF domain-containing protein [Comamonadaceae bacterium]|nr:MAG: GAF domain-containing protein [Comamonadaceae bacterium]